ncbi:PAS domain-containing sensor histidine kinase [Vibrio mangrovi]|uniref:histidine kinase n=1 Tax=Vibrio mangrovi TaxID=474394 RepID=A0A1Y6IXU0_9VIBR|nr:ATP-binding protein [Vibrio mangrovi]MDW6004878.1 ATP-binding protein [Vibrio mangrovi]SMS01640.1 Sensor protein ZraS [Vibrio mangrovi]
MRAGRYRTESISPLRSHLGRRIILILVLISGIVTFFSTVAQLYFNYSQQMGHVEKRHQEIRDIHAHLLAASLWDFNLATLQQRMNDLVLLSDLDYLEIRSGTYKVTAGKPITGRTAQNIYPLMFREPVSGESEQIGTILVASNLQSIYNSLIRDFLTTLVINTLKTAVVCYLILIIFHKSINQRIFSIVHYLQQYNPMKPGARTTQLNVYQAPLITQKNDELSLLVKETNKLTRNLAVLYQNSRAEHTRLTHFAHISSDWLWETDASLNLIYASKGMLKTLHLEEDQHIPFHQIELFQSAQNLQQLLNEKQTFHQCEVAITLYGTQQWLMFQAKARYSDTEKFLGFRGTTLNISELKSVQFALEQLNQDLEHKVQERTHELGQSLNQLKQTQAQLIQSEKLTALGGLVAGVAHEVNTPLGIAITATSVIEDIRKTLEEAFHHQTLTTSQFADLTQRLNSSVGLLHSNLDRASRLIRDFKQTAVDQVSENQSQFNIHQVLTALITSMSPETRKIPVEPRLDGDQTLMMNSLPGVLTQIVANLIMNSTIHAFGNSADTPQISIRFRAEGEFIVFEYRDNGIGIPTDLHDKIFEPFYTTKRGHGGSGLGLSLVFNLVTQKLKGTLQFSSEPGQGVHYSIKLPKGC